MATTYHPANGQNFLKYWINGTYADGTDDEPVTWLPLGDGRTYANWT